MGKPEEIEVDWKDIKREENNIIFMCIDCQKDFLLPTGKLYIKGSEEILQNLSKLTDLAVSKGITVISTGDYHNKEDKEISDTPDFVSTFPLHCLSYEEGSEFIKETYPKLISRHYYIISSSTLGLLKEDNLKRAKDIILYKNEFDIFKGNKYTDEVLEILKPKTIYIYGVALDYCVIYALEGLLERDYEIFLVVDAIKGIDEEKSNKLIEDWKEKGIRILTTEEVEKRFNE